MKERRAVVLLSGGLDSATAAALARREGFALYGLTIRYGQVHQVEIAAARAVASALGFARPGAGLIALIKPQFEAERAEIGKGGVVRDPAVHDRVCAAVADWLGGRGWRIEGIERSPITGPEGNVEFLIAARNE